MALAVPAREGEQDGDAAGQLRLLPQPHRLPVIGLRRHQLGHAVHRVPAVRRGLGASRCFGERAVPRAHSTSTVPGVKARRLHARPSAPLMAPPKDYHHEFLRLTE